MRKLPVAVLVAVLLCCYVYDAWAANVVDLPPHVAKYITIVANATAEDTGRFAVLTVEGDPLRQGDEGLPLIYGLLDGQPPWTSYTTIRVDGVNYVFGGETRRRPGRSARYGEVILPPTVRGTEDPVLVSAVRVGPLVVTQELSITRGSTTGWPDTARIAYTVTNEDEQPHQVGLRIVLDTMLSANDGAPFRVGEQAVTTDTLFTGDLIPEYWQAFDSLANPHIMSQGTLRGPGLTPPDEVLFSNWGSLADNVWEFDYQPGRDFTSAGDFVLDSAVAMRWTPDKLLPGESRRYETLYGLAGISIAPGLLSLGVSAQTAVEAGLGKRPLVPVIAYLQNHGQGDARDLVVGIRLPEELELVSAEAERKLPNLPVGGTTQVMWQVRPRENASGDVTYEVYVKSSNSPDNSVRRTLRIISPPYLELDVSAPQSIRLRGERAEPYPLPVIATVTNRGGSTAEGVYLLGSCLPDFFELAKGDTWVKYIGPLEPGDSVNVRWHVLPNRGGRFTISLAPREYSNMPVRHVQLNVAVPERQVWWEAGRLVVSRPRLLDSALKDTAAEQQPESRETYWLYTLKGYGLPPARQVTVRVKLQDDCELVGGALGVDPGDYLLPLRAPGRSGRSWQVTYDAANGELQVTGLPTADADAEETGLQPLARNVLKLYIRTTSKGTGPPDVPQTELQVLTGGNQRYKVETTTPNVRAAE